MPPIHGSKVVVIGDSGVGKSTILTRYSGERFNPCYVQTQEREIKKAKVQVRQRSVDLQIWDTPGNPRCRTVAAAYMREDVQGVIVVFDVTDDATYYNVQHWVETVNQYAGNGNVKFVFVGNKNDQKQSRKVFIESGEQLAKQYNGTYIDASAKTKENIDQIFQAVAESILGEVTKQANSLKKEHEQDDSNGSLDGGKGGGFRCNLL